MRHSALFCLVLGLFLVREASAALELAFEVDGVLVKQVNWLDFFEYSQDSKIMALGVWEPHEDKPRVFVASPFNEIVRLIYQKSIGDLSENYEAIVFECEDGYNAIVPIEEFRDNIPFLALRSADGEPFMTRNKRQGEVANLGRFYLVWRSKFEYVLEPLETDAWPYKIRTVNIISSVEKFYPDIVVNHDNAPKNLLEGEDYFRQYCFACHSVNGKGGEKATDLADVKSRYDVKTLAMIINNPRSLNPSSTMPPLNPDLPEDKRMKIIFENLIPFLYQLKSTK